MEEKERKELEESNEEREREELEKKKGREWENLTGRYEGRKKIWKIR